jgi:hypothetical protein
MIVFETGKPYPGPVPTSEGCLLNLDEDGGLRCLIQTPGLRRADRQAFMRSFKRYGYLESGTTPPIAFWIWCWPDPLGWMDTNFDSSLVSAKAIDAFFELDQGHLKNMIHFHLLDGPILSAIKIVGLDPSAIKLFHSTIRKQLSQHYTKYEYDKAIAGMYAFSTQELFQMAVHFRH